MRELLENLQDFVTTCFDFLLVIFKCCTLLIVRSTCEVIWAIERFHHRVMEAYHVWDIKRLKIKLELMKSW